MQTPTEVVPLSSILDAVEELKRFASDKSEQIEEFYRYSGPNQLWVHVSIWKNGTYDHIPFTRAQYNAFHLAAMIYHEFAHWNEDDSLEQKLKDVTEKIAKFPAVPESKTEEKLSEARAQGLKTIPIAPLPDQFYADLQLFVQKLAWITDNINNIPEDPTLWEKALEAIFIKHARYLIKEGPVTPEIFNKAYEQIAEVKRNVAEFHQRTQHRLANVEPQIDIDYLYKVTKVCSVWTGSGTVVFKGNKPEVAWRQYSEEELLPKLCLFLGLNLRFTEVIDQFRTIFMDTYLAEVNYLAAERKVHVLHSKEEQTPWTVTQFWSREQHDHSKKMASALSEISRGSAEVEKKDTDENSTHNSNITNP